MSESESCDLNPLKVVMNKHKSKVLFVEAQSDLVDVLLTFLTLPLGSILWILRNRCFTFGILTNLYKNLDHVEDLEQFRQRLCSFGVKDFIIKSATFVLSDDIRIVPFTSGLLQTLDRLGITDIDGAEMTYMSIDANDILDLLKFSLTSATPFTDLLNKKTQKISIHSKGPPRLSFLGNPFGDWTSTRKIVLKMFLQSSTGRFLFAEALNDFVELVSSILFVPLGVVRRQIDIIDNLHRSVKELIDDKYFISPDAKTNLFETGPEFLDLLMKWSKEEGCSKEQTKFVVSDDLTVKPYSITSSVLFLSSLGVSLCDVKEMEIEIDVSEIKDIVGASLSSKTVLTDVLVKPMLK